MSTQPAPNPKDTGSSTLQPDGTSISRFARTLSTNTKSYFSGSSFNGESPLSHPSTPGTPAVGDVIGNPTPFQRFLSMGRTRKGREVQFPPPRWGVGNEQQGEPADAPEEPNIGEFIFYVNKTVLMRRSHARLSCFSC